jgi:hypothetical protein
MQGAINQAENGLRWLDFRTLWLRQRAPLLLSDMAAALSPIPPRTSFAERQNEQPLTVIHSHDKRTHALYL